MTEKSYCLIRKNRGYVMKKTEENTTQKMNPVIKADFPDPDIIRVDDTYYMLSSTLHFLPGAVILRSYDLVDWEIAGYVFETFEGTEEARMTNERNNYGCGMWAGSLRYHRGRFYVSFAAKETCKTYFYSSDCISGPWECTCIDFYFHQGSLFFDEDDRVYLVFGHKELWIRELLPDLSGLKPEGFTRKILEDTDDRWMAYEGVHFYKIEGKYYLFTVNWPKEGNARRTQLCFSSDSLKGEFTGGPVLNDNLGFRNEGIAQGGIVQTNDGKWYAMLMQDRGAAGRAPVLVPVAWRDGFPVFGENGKVPAEVRTVSNRPYYQYAPLYTSDDFIYQPEGDGKIHLKPQWQWNHEPNQELWSIARDGGLCITTGKLCTNVVQAVNTLTQRMFFPASSVEVTIDASDLNEGDYAGLCLLQGCYGMLAVTRELRRFFLVLIEREGTEKNRNARTGDYMPGKIVNKISLTTSKIRLRMEVSYEAEQDYVTFYYQDVIEGQRFRKAAAAKKLYFGMDHFAGARCGLGIFATRKIGGTAVFHDFKYEYDE